MSGKQIKRYEFEDTLRQKGIPETRITEAAEDIFVSMARSEFEQFYLYNDRKLGIIQRQPEYIVTHIVDRTPHDHIILAREHIEAGKKIYGRMANNILNTWEWHFDDGAKTTPPLYLDAMIAEIKG